jgi:plastocyanin domain-containing protein
MDVDWSGYSPSQIKIKKGVPVRWEINGINVSGCANSITIPRLGVFQHLESGTNVVEFTPTETGTLPFSCGMGMINGRFIVE